MLRIEAPLLHSSANAGAADRPGVSSAHSKGEQWQQRISAQDERGLGLSQSALLYRCRCSGHSARRQQPTRHLLSSSTTRSRQTWISAHPAGAPETYSSSPVTCSIMREERKLGIPRASARRSAVTRRMEMSSVRAPLTSKADKSQFKA